MEREEKDDVQILEYNERRDFLIEQFSQLNQPFGVAVGLTIHSFRTRREAENFYDSYEGANGPSGWNRLFLDRQKLGIGRGVLRGRTRTDAERQRDLQKSLAIVRAEQKRLAVQLFKRDRKLAWVIFSGANKKGEGSNIATLDRTWDEVMNALPHQEKQDPLLVPVAALTRRFKNRLLGVSNPATPPTLKAGALVDA